MEHDLTRGNVLKTIAVFALPYMLSYFLQMLYGMADLYMMGQFSGAAGITAVGNGAQTLYIITVTLVGLAMGTTVIVGHAVGSRRFDRAETAIGNTITLFMGVSVALAGSHCARRSWHSLARRPRRSKAPPPTCVSALSAFRLSPHTTSSRPSFADWAIHARLCT